MECCGWVGGWVGGTYHAVLEAGRKLNLHLFIEGKVGREEETEVLSFFLHPGLAFLHLVRLCIDLGGWVGWKKRGRFE